MAAIEYWLSFKQGTFTPDDLLKLITKDLGLKKGFITSGSHKTIPFSDKALLALKPELEKKRYFQVDEVLNQHGLPDGSSFMFVVPAREAAPDNIIWRFESEQHPPEATFNELLSLPGFVFAYAVDKEDSFRQEESWPGNYAIYNLTPEGVKWTKDRSGQRVIDISENPGRSEIVSNARLAVGWKMWFGKEVLQYFPGSLLTSFKEAYAIREYSNGVIEVQLFEDPRGALMAHGNRDIQTAFRKHIGMDAVIAKLKDALQQQFQQAQTAAPKPVNLVTATATEKHGWLARWFGKKDATAPVEDETLDKPIPFGYKTNWLAIKTNDAAAVARHFPHFKFEKALWKNAGNGRVFISPPVNGWVFVHGDIPITDERNGIAKVKSLLIELSHSFTVVAFFGSHRVVDYYSWACARGGEIVRAYAEVSGEVLLEMGEKQGIEAAFIYPHEAEAIPDSFKQDIPDETMVLQIAGDWSLDPMTLDQYEIDGPGLIGN